MGVSKILCSINPYYIRRNGIFFILATVDLLIYTSVITCLAISATFIVYTVYCKSFSKEKKEWNRYIVVFSS